ncbi:sodium/bile acid cotransporter 7 [Kitasatospora gansuensis]|uniref:Sodium/bile acid cotransporter 7 n=1 Tax=Kitasatospora gansuensis TaxID=258050 RepID=A0A7W7WI44_9ACTN|nr:bile acid:sodium symporter family protein [Kitasatospora gansuensis]MBB4947415.1 sodium/bile acid cotransporter 7 [Kitasatospora gansuensis]
MHLATRLLRAFDRRLHRIGIDGYLLLLLGTVGLATLLPARGAAAELASDSVSVAVGLLFFLYGARLSPQEALAGARHWRLHLLILGSTFVLFPLLGEATRLLPSAVLAPQLATGVLFLTLLSSTVQSSIAFTSMARGNVAAAICAATFSSLVGIVLTPLLAAWLLAGGAGVRISGQQVLDIVLQLLVPFALGQLLRRWVAPWLKRHRWLTMLVDRGSILLIVYTAFSEGVREGIWSRVTIGQLLWLAAICLTMLALVLLFTGTAARRLGLSRADRITAQFCGSKKSLANGLPLATILFPAAAVGMAVLPLMLFHQLQLMVCTVLAQRWARQATPDHS